MDSARYCFVVATCPGDVHYTRILLASMHWFHPDCPVVVIADGGVKASALSKLPNVHRFIPSDGIAASRRLLLHGLLSKLNLFFFDEFDYYVFCDADSVLIGDLLRTVRDQMPCDFLALDSRGELDMSNEEHKRMFSHYAFSVDEARERAPHFRYDRLSYFPSSHFCVRPHALWPGLIEEWRPEMRTDFSSEALFKFGDQGFLNFAVNTLNQTRRLEVKMASVVINGKRSPAEYPSVTTRSLVERTLTTKKVIHYTAFSRRLTLKAHNFGWALEYFEKQCYAMRGRQAYARDHAVYFVSKMMGRVRKSRVGEQCSRIIGKAQSIICRRRRARNRLWLARRVSSALSRTRSPFVVKVGANDGVTGDPLARVFDDKADWKGLFIEPVPFCFAKLKRNYPDSARFILENIAVDRTFVRKPFYFVKREAKSELPDLPPWYDQIGSFDRDHILRLLGAAVEPYIEKAMIDCMPLGSLLEKHAIGKIDVLHIDTEGHDYVVLNQFDFSKYSPAVVLFEYKHLRKEERDASLSLLRERQYRVFDCGGDLLALSTVRQGV